MFLSRNKGKASERRQRSTDHVLVVAPSILESSQEASTTLPASLLSDSSAREQHQGGIHTIRLVTNLKQNARLDTVKNVLPMSSPLKSLSVLEDNTSLRQRPCVN